MSSTVRRMTAAVVALMTTWALAAGGAGAVGGEGGGLLSVVQAKKKGSTRVRPATLGLESRRHLAKWKGTGLGWVVVTPVYEPNSLAVIVPDAGFEIVPFTEPRDEPVSTTRNSSGLGGSSLGYTRSVPVEVTAPKAPVIVPRPLVLQGVLDGVDLGDVFALQVGDDIYVEVRSLVEHGFDASVLGTAERTWSGTTYRRVDAPVLADVDEGQGTLTLTAPPDRLNLQKHDLRGQLETATTQTPTSVYLNYGGQLLGLTGIITGQLGVRAGDVFVESTASWTSTQQVPVRGLTTATFELPKQSVRVMAGDVVASSAGFSGGMLLGGVQVARNFAMDPTLVTMPDIGMRGLAQTPSTLEVYVNDRLVSRRLVAPGPFEVNNLPVTEGLGAARYVLRDAFGNEQRVDRPYALTRAALAPGLHAFSYNLGFERTNLATQSFEYGRPMFLGVHRIGLTDVITGEASVQARLGLISFSPRIDFALPFGLVGLLVSGSVNEKGPGVAGGIDYSLMNMRGGVSASVRARSVGYDTLGSTPSVNQLSISGDLRGSVALLPGWSLSASGRVIAWSDRSLEAQATVQTTLWLTSRMSLSAVATHARSPAGSSTSVSALLNVVLGDTVTMTGTITGNDQGAQGLIDAQRTPLGPTGFSARAQLGASQDGFRGTGTAGYTGEHGRIVVGGEGDQGGFRPIAQGSGSLVFIGNRLFVGRAVDSSFALVRAPGVSHAHVTLEHRDIGETDDQGELFVQGLAPWRVNELALMLDEVPADIIVKQEAPLKVAPRPGSGAIALFDTQRMQVIRGKVVLIREGKRVVPDGGLLQLDRGETSPLGHGGEFELEQIAEGEWPMRISYDGISCHATLKVPHFEGSLNDVGVFECRE